MLAGIVISSVGPYTSTGAESNPRAILAGLVRRRAAEIPRGRTALRQL